MPTTRKRQKSIPASRSAVLSLRSSKPITVQLIQSFTSKVWCSERGHEEGHEIDDTETAVFNIVNLFPVKYITFSCLKRAVEEPHMEEGNQETAQCLNAFDVLMQHRLDYVEPKGTRLVSKYT